MKRGCLYLLLAVAFLSLPISAGAQAPQSTNPSSSQSSDDYAFRLSFFIVEKLERSTANPASDPLAQAAKELFAPDKQEQIRKELERKIGPPGSPQRPAKYDALLFKIDQKLSDKKINELRAALASKGRGVIAGWSWPLCVIVGCR